MYCLPIWEHSALPTLASFYSRLFFLYETVVNSKTQKETR